MKKQPSKLTLNKNTMANLDRFTMAEIFGRNQDECDTTKTFTTTTTTTIQPGLPPGLGDISGYFCPPANKNTL